MTGQAIRAPGAISGVVHKISESSAGQLVMLSGHQRFGDVVFDAPVWLPSALLKQPINDEQVIAVSGALKFASFEPFQPDMRLVLEADKLIVKNVGVKLIVGSRKTHTTKAFGTYLEDATNAVSVNGVQVEDLSSEDLSGIGTLVLLEMLELGGVVHCRDPMPRELKTSPLLATVVIEGALTSEICKDGSFPVSFLVASRIELLRIHRELGEANSVEDLVLI